MFLVVAVITGAWAGASLAGVPGFFLGTVGLGLIGVVAQLSYEKSNWR